MGPVKASRAERAQTNIVLRLTEDQYGDRARSVANWHVSSRPVVSFGDRTVRRGRSIGSFNALELQQESRTTVLGAIPPPARFPGPWRAADRISRSPVSRRPAPAWSRHRARPLLPWCVWRA